MKNSYSVKLFSLFIFSIIGMQLKAQRQTNAAVTISNKYVFCENLFKTARTKDERVEMQKHYWILLGIVQDLEHYRDAFLAEGKLIDLFPTAYYHTTVSEMNNIVNNSFKYPIEKMKQMIAFYDAYKWNRNIWDEGMINNVEPHWREHFKYVQDKSLCMYAGNALSTGIAAHVQCDLPRAIAYSFQHRYNRLLSKNDPQFLEDFLKTNQVFKNTKDETLHDIETGMHCSMLSSSSINKIVNWQDGFGISIVNEAYKEYKRIFDFLGLKEVLTDNDVIFLRQQSWRNAFSGATLNNLRGYPLLGQPTLEPHDDLTLQGKKICTEPFKTPFDLFKMNEFIIPSSLKDVFDTKIYVEENDYVFIEATGKVTLGIFAGSAYATGTPDILLRGFNKYVNLNHGSLVFRIGNQVGACVDMFNNEILHPIYTYMAKDASVSIPGGAIPGAYFLAPSSGMLLLEINDTRTSDNVGQFKVKVLTIKQNVHLLRNFFNSCPESESLLDKEKWVKENETLSSYYHGGDNRSYRGQAKENKGCQCVYNKETGLLTKDKYKGTFDIGNWLADKSLFDQEDKNYLHLIFDMVPHDLYEKKSGIVLYK